MNDDMLQIAGLFDLDKSALGLLLDDVGWLATRDSCPSACKVFAEARRLIEHHLVAEQRTLDELEREGHRPLAVAARLVATERELREATEAVWRTISGSDGADHDAALARLRRAIDQHWRADRELLFPALAARYPRLGELDRVVHELVDP